MGFCPGIWMRFCPGIWMRFCPGTWMRFCPGAWMGFCPGAWMTEHQSQYGVLPTQKDGGIWMGFCGFCSVALRHTWMKHLPHARAQAPIQMFTIKMPWQNPIPHWISKCLPSMCPGKNPSMCPDKTPSRTGVHSHSTRAIAWAKHRGHTHVTPTFWYHPTPFRFCPGICLGNAWQMPGQKLVHFSRLTGIPFHM